jgi:CubicO group peptidase (beta-lactamase class C family)
LQSADDIFRLKTSLLDDEFDITQNNLQEHSWRARAEGGGMLVATKAVRTGKLAIVVFISQFLQSIPAQTFSLATKPPAKVESPEVRIKRVEQEIEPLEFKKGEAPLALDLTQIMQLANDPGLSVAVIDGFKIVWAKGYGFTEPAGTKPVTTTTLFQAASISKPVTAMGMLALVQQGKLSLDEDVNAKLKTWKIPKNEFTREQKVTLRRLASHTAGLTVNGFPGYGVDEKLPTLVQIFNGEKPANTPPIRVDTVPGTKEQYSGGGVIVEQQVMMDVTGKPFATLMKQLVLDRISMKDSTYEQPLPLAWTARAAAGTYTDGKAVRGRWHVYPEMAAAGLWTTPTDLAKFAIEIALSKHGRSNKVLSQSTVQQMVTAQPNTDDSGIGFGLPTQQPGVFAHNGANEGFQALLAMNADTGQGIAIMANSDNGILVAEELRRSVAKEYAWKYPGEARWVGDQLTLIAELKGTDVALARFDELKGNGKRPAEEALNQVGYRMLKGKIADAIKIFSKNVHEYPHSAQAYDSLADAYAAAGENDAAIENFKRALKIDPANEKANEQLKKLRRQR